MHNNRFAGTALIVLGAIFLLPQISGVGFPLWQWWPLFPMAAGLVSLSGGNWRGGLILIAIFSVFLLHNLGVLNIGSSSLWPVALIAMGVAIIFGRWPFGVRSALIRAQNSTLPASSPAAISLPAERAFAGATSLPPSAVPTSTSAPPIWLKAQPRSTPARSSAASISGSHPIGRSTFALPPCSAASKRSGPNPPSQRRG